MSTGPQAQAQAQAHAQAVQAAGAILPFPWNLIVPFLPGRKTLLGALALLGSGVLFVAGGPTFTATGLAFFGAALAAVGIKADSELGKVLNAQALEALEDRLLAQLPASVEARVQGLAGKLDAILALVDKPPAPAGTNTAPPPAAQAQVQAR